MDVFKLIDLSIYAQLILIYLVIHNLRNSTTKDPSTRFFIAIVIAIFINNGLELTSWILRGNSVPLAYYSNYTIISILLAFNSVPAALWVRYIDYKILGNIQEANRRLWYYLIPFYISSALIVMNIFTGIVFNLSKENIYTRNYGMYVIPIFSIFMVFIVFIISRRFKKAINGRILESIFLYLLIPLSAGIVQILFFGIPLIWPAFTLATLINFNLVEVETFLKDPLTKLRSRGQFENRLKYILKSKRCFSIIMIDINDFKKINDQFGHDAGDEALLITAEILEESVKRYDTVCRYGGDEFMLLIESSEIEALNCVMERISDKIEAFNKNAIKHFKISLSFGCRYVDPDNQEALKVILEDVDQLMYEDKQLKKQKLS